MKKERIKLCRIILPTASVAAAYLINVIGNCPMEDRPLVTIIMMGLAWVSSTDFFWEDIQGNSEEEETKRNNMEENPKDMIG